MSSAPRDTGQERRPGGADAYRLSYPGRRLCFECTPETVAGQEPVHRAGSDGQQNKRAAPIVANTNRLITGSAYHYSADLDYFRMCSSRRPCPVVIVFTGSVASILLDGDPVAPKSNLAKEMGVALKQLPIRDIQIYTCVEGGLPGPMCLRRSPQA